jgi:hypothetical protein
MCKGLTPYIFHLAKLEREFNVIGGEMLLLISNAESTGS